MNLFTAEKAPAILAIFLAVVGFYVSTVVSEIRGQAVVTYRFDAGSDGLATLRLENVSLASLVQSTRFEMACTDLRPDCLRAVDAAAGRFHSLDRVPPVSPANTQVTSQAAGAQLVATLVPGAVVDISVQQSRAAMAEGAEVEFFYTASRDNPQPLLLMNARSPTAFFVDNYFDIMILAFAAALVGLIGVIILPVVLPLLRSTAPPTPANGGNDPKAR